MGDEEKPTITPSVGSDGHHDQAKLALPQDLAKALKFLDDEQVKRLAAAVQEEAKRRGISLVKEEISRSETIVGSRVKTRRAGAKDTGEDRPTITKGQANAVNAAFRAGVTPSQIARQFGLSKYQVREALAKGKVE
jgi:hypothetical protein